MGNEIAYLMPTEYKIFLGKGALPPYNPCQGASPLDPCEHLAHRQSFPQFKWNDAHAKVWAKKGAGPDSHFWWQSAEKSHSGEFKIGGSMEYLVEMVQIEISLRNYVNYTLWKGLSCAFKTLKPMSFRGLRPLDPWCHDGISDENSSNWN